MKWLAPLLLLLASPSQADEGKSATELRAALIFQLSKVIYFPPQSISDEIQLCLLRGDGDEMAAYFGRRNGLLAQGKPFNTRLLGNLDDTSACALLYVNDSTTLADSGKSLQQLSAELITIGDDRHFLSDGGLISLIDSDGHMGIMVNRPLLQGATARLPSRVLSLARFYPE